MPALRGRGVRFTTSFERTSVSTIKLARINWPTTCQLAGSGTGASSSARFVVILGSEAPVPRVDETLATAPLTLACARIKAGIAKVDGAGPEVGRACWRSWPKRLLARVGAGVAGRSEEHTS